jgi:predicted alpha/beta hydrolase
VGHSLGGQLTGLMPNCELLNGLVLVFAPKGDIYEASLKAQLQGILFMGLYMPLTISLFGYAPVRFLMTAQDLPAGVARDWIRLVFHREWIKGHFAERGEEIHYDKIKGPILSLALDTDSLARPAACAKLLREYYGNAESELITLRVADAAEPLQLTHLGYFRKKFADSHWSQVAGWLDRQLAEFAHCMREPEALTA